MADPVSTKTLLKHIDDLLAVMETCHECGGLISLADYGPTHCEDCSSFCDNHEWPECTSIEQFHTIAKWSVGELRKRVNVPNESFGVEVERG